MPAVFDFQIPSWQPGIKDPMHALDFGPGRALLRPGCIISSGSHRCAPEPRGRDPACAGRARVRSAPNCL